MDACVLPETVAAIPSNTRIARCVLWLATVTDVKEAPTVQTRESPDTPKITEALPEPELSPTSVGVMLPVRAARFIVAGDADLFVMSASRATVPREAPLVPAAR